MSNLTCGCPHCGHQVNASEIYVCPIEDVVTHVCKSCENEFEIATVFALVSIEAVPRCKTCNRCSWDCDC